MSTRVHIVMADELVAAIDGARGLVPRSAWVGEACRRSLVGGGQVAVGDPLGHVPGGLAGVSAAKHFRESLSSASAKANVKPIEKGR